MSVRNFKPWELDLEDMQRYQDVLPKDEAVQYTFTGWGKPANKSFLETCKHDIDQKPPTYSKLNSDLARSRKRSKLF